MQPAPPALPAPSPPPASTSAWWPPSTQTILLVGGAGALLVCLCITFYIRLRRRRYTRVETEVAPTPDASLPRLLGDVDSLDEFEIDHFKRIAKYMKPNPRAIKRISSMYRLARLMVLSRARSLHDVERRELLRRLLVWIVLCEQWPVHMAWSLQVLEDIQQRRHLHFIRRGEEDENGLEDDPEQLSFREFYHGHVKHHVFNVHQRHCPEPLRQRYQRIFSLEHDKEIFDCLIADGFDIEFELRVEHIGTLMRARDATMLISYCTNLNPALVSLLSLVKSVPQSADEERNAKDLVGNSEHKHQAPQAEGLEEPPAASEATQSQQQKPASEIGAAKPETSSVAQTSSVARGGDASAVEQVVQKPDQAKKQTAKVKVSLTKDDKTGRDHIGSADYALCLASLIFGALQTPCVIGIYAQWGTGKSFMMEKITAALKALQLEQVLLDEVHQNLDPALYLDDLRDLLTNEEEQIQLMFKWLQMGLPELPPSAFCTVAKRKCNLVAPLDSKYFDRLEAANEQLDVTPIWLLCQLVARFFVAICKPFLLLSKRCAHLVRGPAFDTSSAPMLHQLMRAGAARRRRQASMHPRQITSRDYHYIWWNAWLYSGSDNLWAGLIKALHEAVEERYGAPYARARRDAMMISVGVQVLLAAVLMAVAITFCVESFQQDFSLAVDGITQSLTRSFAVLLTAASSIGLSISSIRQWLRTPVSESAKIVDDAASGAIRQKLGFMHIIKKELDRLGKVLQGERPVPNFLDYLLPTALLNGHTHSLLLWLLGLSQHGQDFQPCRMVIYVDDLDRCPTQKIMEVLQSLVLLTEGTPFIILLAIDQRVVVTAIENSGEGLYTDAGVNGHEYLDKIVQIPFVIPQLADNEKAKLCKGYLTPAAKRQSSAQSPVVILSTLDDRLVAVLEAGDIRLLRVKWLESQPDDYRMQRRQELEEHQEEIEKRGGMTPLLGCKEAADLVRNGKREVGALSYGWILPWDPDPTGERIKLLRQELSQRPYIKGLFWDQATLYQPPRTEAQQNSFERAEEVMMDLYASAVGTTVLQIKEVPPRPSEYDGLLCLGGVPRIFGPFSDDAEAMLAEVLQRFGPIEHVVGPASWSNVARVKFTTHEAAEQATVAAPNLGVCKYAFIAYQSTPWDDRGWCVCQEELSLEVLARLAVFPKIKSTLDSLGLPPKLLSLTTGKETEEVELQLESTELQGRINRVIARIGKAKFTDQDDAQRVPVLYRDYVEKITSKLQDALALEEGFSA